ncbi:hypothetical protein P8605_40140 [Streptomyces sp. T-3]|nr:hypothetical protein [Streptomyces sp. T-3]
MCLVAAATTATATACTPAPGAHTTPTDEQRQTVNTRALNGDSGHSAEVTTPTGATVARSTTGCLARAAADRLYGDFGKWARCMREKGHAFETPGHARKSIGPETSTRARAPTAHGVRGPGWVSRCGA